MAVDQIARMMALDAAQQGGGSGTSNYDQLTNKPSINGVTLTGDKTTSDLGIVENVQADWDETDSTAPSYIQNKPNIPAAVTVDQAYDSTSTNPQSGTAVAQAIAKKPGEITTGKQYTIDGKTVTADVGAEVFNNYTNNIASGNYSHAEGYGTTSSGSQSHAEGYGTTSSGAQSHAEGFGTTASGVQSHAEGLGTTASGAQSHAEGNATIAASENQHVQGKFNVEDSTEKYAFIIGNGTEDYDRHNAFAIDWNGLIYVNGAATGVDVSQLTAVAQAVSGKISATDYATQTTGGTVKAWTTTDGSDTILHLATQ